MLKHEALEADYIDFLNSNEKQCYMITTYLVVVAFYKFFELENLNVFQALLKSIFDKTNIKGTILIASEGVNGTISGKKK